MVPYGRMIGDRRRCSRLSSEERQFEVRSQAVVCREFSTGGATIIKLATPGPIYLVNQLHDVSRMQ